MIAHNIIVSSCIFSLQKYDRIFGKNFEHGKFRLTFVNVNYLNVKIENDIGNSSLNTTSFIPNISKINWIFIDVFNISSSIIRQRENLTVSLTCAYQSVKMVFFFGTFGKLCFLVTSILRLALLPYYRRVMVFFSKLLTCFEIFEYIINCFSWLLNFNWFADWYRGVFRAQTNFSKKS